MNDYLAEERALIRDWVDASEDIRDRFGLEKALGYLVGEKFYHMIRYSKSIIANCNQAAYEDLLAEFSALITSTYSQSEIHAYFRSNPRLGPLGHTATEEEHALIVERGGVEHSIETEVQDALVLGKMMKLLTK